MAHSDAIAPSRACPLRVGPFTPDNSQASQPNGPESSYFDSLAEAMQDSIKKHGNPIAPIRYHLRAHYGIDSLDLTGGDDPFLFDLFQVEFGLTPAELGELTLTPEWWSPDLGSPTQNGRDRR